MHSYLELSFLIKTPLPALFLGILVLLFGIYIRFSARKDNPDNGIPMSPKPIPETKPQPEPETYPPITPLPQAFNWETTDPIILRPFKPKYHLTMGITTLEPSELIPMDKTYLSRLALRKQLLQEHPDVVRAVNIREEDPGMNRKIREALFEWYAFVMGSYLPTRYPSMFRLLEAPEEKEMIESLVTGFKVPTEAGELIRSFSSSSSSSTVKEKDNTTDEIEKEKQSLLLILDTLGSWIDEDFLILLPSYPTQSSSPLSPSPNPDASNEQEDPKYHLQSYTTYYPAGFDTRTKLSLPLSQIHTPVPGYKEKLEKSMDRFFARLDVGRFVVRVNWSVMTRGTGLFAAFGGLHDHNSGSEEREIEVEGFDGKDTYLRCERQTLHRLPKSKALIFAFHTYTYPIIDIKAEGLGEDLAVAIDGLKGGNVPEIYPYKRGPYWGEAVKGFLRS
ncbi:hypothetical protein BDV12DRAFT_90990 [Aspergillus spectabilis]